MDRFADLDARIERLCARAAAGDEDPRLVDEMNDTLSEGYARALEGDQQLVELDERLVELMLAGDDRRAEEIAVVHARRWALARRVERLREQLARMYDRFVVLSAR